ncbi:hypothetical protein DL98DRAFT_648836 [Cadophora sp. DSE1049]|nr:hypothetical protein DL98DRAFT_648836 [Cadophora sp. DSE1049]
MQDATKSSLTGLSISTRQYTTLPSFFPENLNLDKSFSNNILAKGTSTWRTAQSPCDLPSFDQEFFLQVASDRPVILDISGAWKPDFDPSRFCGEDGEHLAVLILAWTCILSARWAEIIPGVSGPEYGESQARWDGWSTSFEKSSGGSGKVIVDLGEVDDDAARWWAAVLAPDRGWSASIMSDGGHILYSPWYTKVLSEQPFKLSRNSGSPPPLGYRSAASFTKALSYLFSYCKNHNAFELSHAALAAALLLPVARYENRIVHLSPPRARRNLLPTTKPPYNRQNAIWNTNPKYLDSLLTLSCNAVGVKALLNSIFFETGVESNICGAWLQGTFEFFSSARLQDQHVLLQVLMKRDPALSFLWLGAFITGAHRRALQEARQGWWKIELNTAAWTGTLMSFIQEPLADRWVGSGGEEISRADECRLLYLGHEQYYTVPPLFPFAPFGSTALHDTNIEVHQHARCEAHHGLEYESLRWRCLDNNKQSPSISFLTPPLRSKIGCPETGNISVSITYENLDYEDDDCSEMVTRNIFTWLRDEDGFPLAERAIRQHEWIDNLDDDDDCPITGDTMSIVGRNLHGWLGNTMTWRSNSL